LNPDNEYRHEPPPPKWRNNIYFYWWEFLRRNEGYMWHCEQLEDSEYSQLFQDFGDVRADDFDSWWERARQLRLFQPGERSQEESQAVEPIKNPPNHDDLADENFLYLKVSLRYSKRDLNRYFAEALEKERERHHFVSSAAPPYENRQGVRYPVIGQPSIKSLMRLLEVYDFRRANPKMPLWQAALELGLFQMEQAESMKDWKNVAGSMVGRYLTKAKVIIENVGRGRFPDYHPHRDW
jgi:hypothetical protein